MWELLQKIEQRWWKPYWKSIAELTETEKNIRLLTSRSSWLWQFVCRNKLYPKNRWHKWENDLWNGEIYYEDERQYYVIESALCDESELEQYLQEILVEHLHLLIPSESIK